MAKHGRFRRRWTKQGRPLVEPPAARVPLALLPDEVAELETLGLTDQVIAWAHRQLAAARRAMG